MRALLLLMLVIGEHFQNVLPEKIVDSLLMKNQFKSDFLDLLITIKVEKYYDTLFIDTCSTNKGVIEPFAEGDTWLKQLAIPFVIMPNDAGFLWKTYFTREILVIKCVTSDILSRQKTELNEVLKKLAFKLQHMRQTRVLLLVDAVEGNNQNLEVSEKFQDIFISCDELQLSNVLILLRDIWTSGKFYGYEKFPKFRLKQRSFTDGESIFPNPVGNLLGHPLYTLPDQMKPRSIVYEDASGKQILSGYIGKLLQTYAQKINASLQFPFRIQLGINSFMGDLENITRTGLIEIGTALDGPKERLNPYEFSIPVEYARWMPMLPVEPQLSVEEMFLLMFQSRLFQLILALSLSLSLALTLCTMTSESGLKFWEFLLNERALRGILGQSFPLELKTTSRKELLVCVLIFIASLLVTTSYGAFLQSLLTEPPTQKRIDTFDDLLNSKLILMVAQQELMPMKIDRGEEFVKKYLPTFEVIENFTDYMTRRNSFNNTYGYTVTTSIWPLLEQIQAGFKRKMFRLSPAMYFEAVVIFCLPVRENSIFMDSLNEFIMQVHDSGLMQYWRTATFIDMVAYKMIDLRDLSQARIVQGITAQDLNVVWTVYAFLMAFCFGIFIIELWIFKLIKRREMWYEIRLRRF